MDLIERYVLEVGRRLPRNQREDVQNELRSLLQDMVEDPQYNARGMFEEVDVPAGTLTIPAMAPKLTRTPGYTTWAGPEVGANRDEILQSLGYDQAAIERLASNGDI